MYNSHTMNIKEFPECAKLSNIAKYIMFDNNIVHIGHKQFIVQNIDNDRVSFYEI